MEQIPTKRPHSNSDSDSSQSPQQSNQASSPQESPNSLDISSPQRRRYSRRTRQKNILTRHSYSIPAKSQPKTKKAKLSDSQDSSEDHPSQPMYQPHGMSLYTSIHPSFQSLLSGLEASDDIQILQSLTQLSMDLAMIHEDLLTNLPVEQLVNALITCLSKDTLQDIPLYAMNSLTNILDAIPNIAGLIVASGGIGILCSKLMNFEFIDMAEHAIKTLEKMSYEHATAIIKEGAFGLMIGTIDFFEAEIQKKILTFAINVARSLNSQDYFVQYVAPSLQSLVNMLGFRGSDFVQQNEKTLDFFTILTTSLIRMCCTDYEKLRYFLQIMIDQGLVKALYEIINHIPVLVSKAFKLLHILCKNASSATQMLLSLGISCSLKETLLKWQEKNEKSENSIMEALHLTETIIPKVNSDDIIEREKIEIYSRHPQYLQTLGDTILPQIISLYEHFVSKEMKSLVITILDKILEQSPPDLMLTYVAPQYFSTFIAELLSSRDLYTIKNALKIVNVLYEKIPDQVSTNFIREGVLDRVQNLKSAEKLRELSADWRNLYTERVNRAREESRYADPLMMFRFSHGLERSYSVHEDPSEGLSLRRYRSESMDITHDQKKDIISLCKSALDKSKNYENKRAVNKQKQLKELANKLENGDGESAAEIWRKLITLIESDEAISQFEISYSGIPEAIWKWLDLNEIRDQTNNNVCLKRLEEFLKVFFENNSKNETHIASLVTLLLGSIQFLHSFTVSPPDNNLTTLSGIRSLSQRVRLHFQYCPDEIDPVAFYDLSTEYLTRHNFFSISNDFSIAIEQFNTFDSVKSLLLRVRSKEDLLYFQEAFHHNIDFRRENPSNLRRQIRDLQFGTVTNPMILDMDIDNDLEEFNTEIVMPRERKSSEINGNLVVNLYCKGNEITKGMTVFEIINRQDSNDEPVIKFRFSKSPLTVKGSSYLQTPIEIYHNILEESRLIGIDSSEKIYPCLRLLKLIFKLNEQFPQIFSASSILFPSVSDSLKLSKVQSQAFKSQKLSALLTRQLQDSISTTSKNQILALPKHCHFLFPYTLRTEYIQATGFGGFRSLQYFLDRNQNKERFRVQKQKQKVKIQREKLLQSAMVIMSDIRLLKQGILEIEFENEIGTGQGPTLEFYSLVAKEIRALNIWRNQGEETGLFPSPLKASDERYRDYFTFLGRFVAKALIDKRYIDVPLSPIFWKLVLYEPTTLADVVLVDKNLGKFLMELQEIVNKKHSLISQKKSPELNFRGSAIEDLALNFTLPSYDFIDLKRNGKNIFATLDNLEEYINLAAQNTLLMNAQAQAFRVGLESLFPSDTLKNFMGSEFETLICGEADEKWDIEELKLNIKPDHGYTSSSPTFKNLLYLMSQFTFKEKRLFMQFISGSPRLPPGGFSGLNPKLTVVRKEASMPGISDDEYLPSVMTCQNYLKIPDYSSLEILQKNLKYAIEEGHEAFHLS